MLAARVAEAAVDVRNDLQAQVDALVESSGQLAGEEHRRRSLDTHDDENFLRH